MATTQRIVRARPEEVFAVLADPRSYSYWVVGSSTVRDADDGWPARRTRFHHTVGWGPLRVRDHTEVEDVEPGRFLQLLANARPFGVARVKLDLEPVPGGTEVTMVERPAGWFGVLGLNPLVHVITHVRNVRSLGRLAELAEGRARVAG